MKRMKKMERVERKKLDKKCIISFWTAILCMLLVLQNMGVLFGGRNSLIEGDLMENYIPAIKNLCRDIINRESLYYSWNMGLGMNTSLYNAYYALNPFNILYLFFYNSYDNTVTIIIIAIKTGLAAMCFHLFVTEAHDVQSPWSIAFSVAYSMCAFQVSYNITNIIWLDAMFILPVVFLGINRVVYSDEYRLLLFGYSYIFIFQFYMGYMIGIISLFYFLVVVFVQNAFDKQDQIARIIIRYLTILLLAIGLSAFVWLPTLSFLLNSNPTDASNFEEIHLTIQDFLKSFLWRNISGTYTNNPNLYCGILTVLLLPFFFFISKVGIKNKIIYGSLMSVLFISCFNPLLYKLWHGFDAPDGWSYRFSYIISFVLCVAASIVASNLRVNKRIIRIIVVALGMTEIVLAYRNQPLLQTRMEKLDYDLWNISEKEIAYSLDENTGLFRVNTLNNYSINPGIYYGYNGISYFSTAENPIIRNELSKLGLYTSPRMVLNFGLTPVTKMLLDVKYDSYGALQVNNATEQDLFSELRENDQVLGIGFLVAGNPQDYNLESTDPFRNLNCLLSLMTGGEIEVFEQIDKDQISREENGVRLANDPSKEGYIVETDNPNIRINDANMTYHITCEGNESEQVYAYVENEISIKSEQGFLMEGGYENVVRNMGNMAVSYIKQLDKEEGGYRLRIIPIDNVMSQPIKRILFYAYNSENLKKTYDELSDGQLIVEEYNDGYVKGRVSVSNDSQLLFTTIPYEKGWTAKVDGYDTDIVPIMNDAFIGIALPNYGEHVIELRFRAEGAVAGIIISIICFTLIILLEKRYTEKLKQINETERSCDN